MHIHVHQLLTHYGYLGVFFILMMEMIGVPFPAETTLTVAGLEWTQGVFSFWPLLAAAALGNIVGSTVAYTIGAGLGRPAMLRIGRLFRLTETRFNAVERRIGAYGLPLLIAGKFIAGVRVLMPYLFGMNRMKFWVFSLLNGLAAVLWAGLFIGAGSALEIAWSRYHAVLTKHLTLSIIIISVLIGAYLIYRIGKKADMAS
ncbi:DedA family protein [Alicyclobacillus mengziensis]|uniref:DedA family protein n=1 Tax=Alicyclobacillus mengziensis TaxID=2931921 RepID=A0A9X7VWJ2_9BACL|nr:DedA family protein [Alicyclobacillus mengziensis]QSO46391.1 DedA family protein [Alicyclobacillus mengziensis]